MTVANLGTANLGTANLSTAADGIVIFKDSGYVDIGGEPGNEADTIEASLGSLGHSTSSFTGITASDFATALAGQATLVIPELESGDLAPDLSAEAITEISTFVADGGLLLAAGTGARGTGFLNTVFGFSTVTGTASSSAVSLITADAAGTPFAGGPATLAGNNAIWGRIPLASLPAGSKAIYTDTAVEESTVSLIPFGSGKIVVLGWDWFNALPLGSADGGWLEVLDNAVSLQAEDPSLEIASLIPSTFGTPVDVSIDLMTSGAPISGIAFSIDYDESCLDLDPTDSDSDGIPDSITLNAPASFLKTVFFDLGDSDGEVDISLASSVATLSDSTVATVRLTPTCAPVPPDTVTAPVNFSSDPSASFSNTSGQSVPGTTQDGSVEIFAGVRGDCNNDDVVNIADVISCEHEVFDGDGNFWLDVPGGTFPGNAVGCDANADLAVDVGDMTCKNRLIFDLGCAAPLVGVFDIPTFTLPHTVTIRNGLATVQVRLDPGSHLLSGAFFLLDYDESLLAFDGTDANLDGIPDAVRFLGTPVSKRRATFEPSQNNGELSFLLADLIQTPRTFGNGPLVEIDFQVLGGTPVLFSPIQFSTLIPPAVGDIEGRSILAQAFVVEDLIFSDGFESGSTSGWSLTVNP